MATCKYILTVLLLCFAAHISAQDTAYISIDTADKMFLQKNLLALGAQLNVDAQKAQQIQAKLYPNPNFSAELHAYDAQTKQAFNNGSNGEKAFNIDQLLLLGGKRKNAMALAAQNTQAAQYQLEDVLRNLKYQLHTGMYNVYFNMLTVKKYDEQLAQLNTIIKAYESQVQKNNVSLREVVRLKSVYLQLNNDKTELLQDVQDEEKDLQVLLQTQQFVLPGIDTTSWYKYLCIPTLDSLQQQAMQQRPDYKLADLGKSIADVNLKYQRSLAVPDLDLGAAYDQRGGAFLNQYTVTAGIPLPFWNRNQGNVKAAQVQIKSADVNIEQQQSTVYSEVTAAWSNMQRSINEYNTASQIYNEDFTIVLNGMTQNFLKGNISLIEYVDFFQSYNQNIAEINRIRKNLFLSAETVNYTTQSSIY